VLRIDPATGSVVWRTDVDTKISAGVGADGFTVAVATARGEVPLAAELSKIKSLTTVNTAPLVQAIAGGILAAAAGTLRPQLAAKRAYYRANRDAMLSALERELGAATVHAGRIRWNRPAGGFFLSLTLPFAFDEACLEICARDYGVIVCPLSFFSLAAGREHQIIPVVLKTGVDADPVLARIAP